MLSATLDVHVCAPVNRSAELLRSGEVGRRGPAKEFPERLTVPVEADVKVSLETLAATSGSSLASVVRDLLATAMEESPWERNLTD